MPEDLIRFRCPCGRELKAPVKAAGRKAKCPKCMAMLRVPTESDVSLRHKTVTAKKVDQSTVSVRPDQAREKPDARSPGDRPAVAAAEPAEPEPPVDPMEAARQAFAANKDKRARELLNQVMVSDYNNSEARMLSAKLYERQMEVDLAIREYLNAADAGAPVARQLALDLLRDTTLDKGWKALEADDGATALEQAKKTQSMFPQLLDARLLEIEAKLALGRTKEAWPLILALEQAGDEPAKVARLKGLIRESDPEIQAELERREAEERMTELRVKLTTDAESALADIEELIGEQPDFIEAFHLKGQALESLGRKAEALVAYQPVLESDPSDQRLAARCLRLLKESASADDQLAWLNQLIEADRTSRELLEARIEILGEIGDTAGVLADLQHLVLVAPGDSNLYEQLGQAQLDHGDTEAALSTYETALRQFPDSRALYAKTGSMQRSSGRLENAALTYERGVSRFPDDTQLHLWLGAVLSELGRTSEANTVYDELLRSDPQNTNVFTEVAQFQVRTGNLLAASSTLQQAHERFPDRSEFRFNLGSLQMMQGRYEDAIGSYTAVLDACPDDRQTLINRAACYRLKFPCEHGRAIADLRRADEIER